MLESDRVDCWARPIISSPAIRPVGARSLSISRDLGEREGASGNDAAMLRLDASVLDYAILAVYFLVVLGIGVVARMSVKTDIDFFLSGRSLPAWITGLAFVAANLGALEILGMAANGAQYGVATVHFYGSAPSRRWSSWAS